MLHYVSIEVTSNQRYFRQSGGSVVPLPLLWCSSRYDPSKSIVLRKNLCPTMIPWDFSQVDKEIKSTCQTPTVVLLIFQIVQQKKCPRSC